MYDDEIRNEMKNCSTFEGVYMADTIPRNFRENSNWLPKNKEGKGMIINLDVNKNPGTHWVAFWRNPDGTGEYFDSFGARPPSNLMASLQELSPKELIYSNVTLQHESSSSCGLYCIFFLRHKCLGISLHCILSHFSRCKSFNEVLVTFSNLTCK